MTEKPADIAVRTYAVGEARRSWGQIIDTALISSTLAAREFPHRYDRAQPWGVSYLRNTRGDVTAGVVHVDDGEAYAHQIGVPLDQLTRYGSQRVRDRVGDVLHEMFRAGSSRAAPPILINLRGHAFVALVPVDYAQQVEQRLRDILAAAQQAGNRRAA